MTHEESIIEARRLFAMAGIAPDRIRIEGQHPHWLVAVKGLGSSATDATDETMNQPHECAAALLRGFGVAIQAEAEEDSGHVEDAADAAANPSEDMGTHDASAANAGADEVVVESRDEVLASAEATEGDILAPTDADFSEIDPDLIEDPPLVEGADAEFPALDVEPEDFAPDKIEPDDVAAGVAIFGDNLPMQRLLLIGRVTQKAAEIKAILQDGWTVEEFASLQNLIMRIDQGLAPDDEHARARFTALSEASRAMSAVDAYADAQVAFLNEATREQIDSYDPEEGWP